MVEANLELDRELVELRGQRERRLVVRVVHAGQRVRADVEGFVPLQDHRQGLLHLLGLDVGAVDPEGSGPTLAHAAEVVEGQRACPHAVVLEVELHDVLAGGQHLGPLPLDAVEIDHVPQEHRLAVLEVEAVAAEPAARGQDHALGRRPSGTSISAVIV